MYHALAKASHCWSAAVFKYSGLFATIVGLEYQYVIHSLTMNFDFASLLCVSGLGTPTLRSPSTSGQHVLFLTLVGLMMSGFRNVAHHDYDL